MTAAPVDPYTTSRKVYACGARVSEIPLPAPDPGAVESGLARLTVPDLRRPRRRVFRRLNYCAVPGYAPLCLDGNDPQTVECAFRQRLFRELPTIDNSRLGRLALFVSEFLTRYVPVVRPYSFEEWLEMTSYSVARKNQLRDAFDALRGGLPPRKLASHIDTFVKSEFYTTWKHARMINSRHDAFKAWSGPRFRAIEDAVYRLPQFIKHVPVPERPSLISSLRKAGCRYFQTDFTAFESHFSPSVMNSIECQLYRHCLKDDAHVDYLCGVISGRNEMRTRSGVRARVLGRRMSGDMCTSLGNGFTNLMLALFIAAEHNATLEGFVEGDDGIFRADFDLDPSDYASVGFTIKIIEVPDPCVASFCGLIFGDSGEIVRDPRKFLMGFGWTHSFIGAGDRIMDELLRAKALSCVYETPQCPIIGAFARYALKRTSHVSPRFVDDGFHTAHDCLRVPEFCPSLDTRLLFESLFSISVQDQLKIEALADRGDFVGVSRLLPPTVDQEQYSSMFLEVT